jgi:hypothetical protein
VSFGAANPPPFRSDVRTTRYQPGSLKAGTQYYWRVDAVTPGGVMAGPVWTFTVSAREAGTIGGGQPVSVTRPRVVLEKRPSTTPGNSPWRVRIVLVGDSTVTDDSGWGTGFKARVVDRAECVNLARNGRSSKSYRDEGLWGRVLEAKADYVLIQFGHNDMPAKARIARPTRARRTVTICGATLSRPGPPARSRCS